MIALENITMHFGGLYAVNDVSLVIPEGGITGLIGPNGAGKTTLFNIIAGRLAPSAGRILLDGENITALKPHERSRKGLARTFQIPHEFSRLTAIENLMVAGDNAQGESVFNTVFRRGLFAREEQDVLRQADEIIDFLDLGPVRDQRAGNLSGGQKKLLELGRALMRKPRIILLDEIGAGINRTLLSRIAGKIKLLNAEHGYTFCLIEHDLDYVSKLCNDVIVMAEGCILTRGDIAAVRNDERVIEAYFGGGKYEGRT